MKAWHTTPPSSSRLAPARRRARTVKVASAGAALAGFGLVAVLVRGAHPGTTTAPASGRGLDLSLAHQPGGRAGGLLLSVRLRRAVVALDAAPGVDPDLVSTHRFQAMGCEVVVGGATGVEAAAIERLFATLEASLSRFRRDSDLGRLNRSAATAVVVSPLLATALQDALDAAAATNGIVDPTIAAALEAAGYDRTFSEIETDGGSAAPAGRWREIRLSGSFVRRPPGLRLDLNGVVKGRAVDDALALIEGSGFVSAGGDLATRGELVVAVPGGGTVTLRSGALATSGVTTRSWTRGDGRTAHHLIDPATGAPADVRWECVTVCAATCLAADVAAKAAFLQGDDGPEWLERRGLQGRFVTEGEVVLAGDWPESARGPVCT